MKKSTVILLILAGIFLFIIGGLTVYILSNRAAERKKAENYADEVRSIIGSSTDNYSVDVDYKKKTVNIDVWYENVTLMSLAMFGSGKEDALSQMHDSFQTTASALNEGRISMGLDKWHVQFRVVDAESHDAPLALYVDGKQYTDMFDIVSEGK